MKSIAVLVIDDESVICDACDLVLAERGHRVDLCVTGRAGLQAIEKGKHDVILLDLKLPDIDGMEILQTVQQVAPSLCDRHDRLFHHVECRAGHETRRGRLSGQTFYRR